MTSRRPINIAVVKIHFATSFRPEKFPDGPISDPKPGPMLAIAVAAPEIDVMKSRPVIDSATATIPKITVKNTKNDMTELSTSSLTVLP